MCVFVSVIGFTSASDVSLWLLCVMHTRCISFCSYFNEPECDGGEEGMDALRQRIAAEYKWSETSLPPSSSSSSSQQPAEAEPEGGGEGGEEEEEEDPLEAFMAGIEVRGVACLHRFSEEIHLYVARM